MQHSASMLRLRLPALALSLLLVAACSSEPISAERTAAPPTAVPAAPIPGSMVEGFAPNVNDQVAVIGVAIGGSLPVRVFPGIEQNVVARVPGTETELFGFGQTFVTEDDRTWWLVRWQDSQGWIEPGAAYLGARTDVSVTVAGNLPASTFASPGELIDGVTSQYSETPIIVEQLVDTSAGTLETTIDLLAETDLQRGRRLTVAAEADGDVWRLTQAIETPLCTRGVDDVGSCIG